MKISKVGHAKVAVGIKNNGQEGILYIDPSKKNESVKNLDKRFSERNNSAMRLYNCLNQIKKGTEKKYTFDEKESIKDINLMLKQIRIGKEPFSISAAKAACSNSKHGELSEASIDKVLEKLTRKSLSRGEVFDGLKDLVKIFYSLKSWTPTLEKEVQVFLDKYNENYNKNSQKNKTVKAIKNQNMLVQPDTSNSSVISLAKLTNSTEVKTAEKEAFSRFLFNYADLDEKNRNDMRLRLRRLLVLYFYGKDEVSNISGVWDDHATRRDNTEPFCKIIETKEKNVKTGQSYVIKKIDKDDARLRNISCYRNSIEVTAEDAEGIFFKDQNLNAFWIHHMENAVERILKHVNKKQPYKIEKGYLGEKTWKDMLNLMSIKYIAIGKAVYNFAMDDLSNSGNRNLGVVSDKWKNGISSFEYEVIKAEETLQREVSVHIAFAANNLSSATINAVENKEDILLIAKKQELSKLCKPDIKRNILQFFGGQSTWTGVDLEDYYKEDIDLLMDIKNAIYSLRNENFHFTTFNKSGNDWNKEAFGKMFEHEAEKASKLPRVKFYSNNLPMFYRDEDLKKILDLLYKSYAPRASQVPSYNTVFVRKNFPSFVGTKLMIKGPVSEEERSKWLSALYYLFKEIYYNLFLQDNKTLELFYKKVEELVPADKAEKLAIADFSIRIRGLKKLGSISRLEQICQIIMTEQNLQNSGNKKVKSYKASKKNKEIFQHYKMLLYKAIIETFAEYLKKEEFSFIKNELVITKEENKAEAEQWLKEWSAPLYETLVDDVKQDIELQKWYITSRFINGKQLNQLVGSLRHYIQYVEDVERRSVETNNKLKNYDPSKVNTYKKILEVLDLCRQLCSSYTNVFTDYFADEDDYADYVKHFLNYDEGIDGSITSSMGKLQAFANEKIKDDQVIGLYFDGKNPILKRNIVMAKLFGPENILEKIITPVQKSDIREYYDKKAEIAGYLVKGFCQNEQQQKDLVRFQELKNRIEFSNIVDYSEIINELLGQLINWSFIRERDLLYFQLGFHYMCLNNDKEKPVGYSEIIDAEGNKVTGAILNQVAGMYIYGLSVYTKNDKGDMVSENANASSGAKIKQFLNYTKTVIGFEDKEALYNAGLELFENISEHDNITALRNYIDHFHYYVQNDRSILDLYSEVHDRFFTYDMKYQKNVGNLLENILLKHFVVLSIDYGTGKKKIGLGDKAVDKKRASISIAKDGITSDEFTYKLDDGSGNNVSKINMAARSKDYLTDIAKILMYPSRNFKNLVGETKISKTTSKNKNGDFKFKKNKKIKAQGNIKNQAQCQH